MTLSSIRALLQRASRCAADASLDEAFEIIQDLCLLVPSSQGLIRWIIDSNRFDVNKCDKLFGNTILHTVVYSDVVVSARVLLIKGANPNAQNYHLETPLHWCCKTNAVKCATLLMNNGANINVIDNSGSSLLHLVAAYGGSVELVSLLLDNGIDVAMIDFDGKKAIDIAFELKDNGPLHLQLYNYLHARNSMSVIAESVQQDSDCLLSTTMNPVKVSIQKKKAVKAPTGSVPGNRTAVITKRIKPEKVVKKPDFIEELLKDDVFSRPAFPRVDGTVRQNNCSNSPVVVDALAAVKVAASKFVEDVIDNRRRKLSAATTSAFPVGSVMSSPNKTPIIDSDQDEKESSSAPVSPNHSSVIIRSKSAPLMQPSAALSTFAIRRVEYAKPGLSAPIEDRDATDKLCTVIGVLPESSNSQSAPMPSLLKEISRQKDKIAEHFPAAKYIPFLPSNPEHLDVYVAVEQCTDCSNHSWSLWHDDRKYSSYGDLIIAGLISQLILKEYPINLYAYKSKPEHARLGACDVTIAVFTENKSSVIDGNSFQTGWITHTLHSKIETSRWPSLKRTVKQAVKFLKVILVLYNNSQLRCRTIGESCVDDALQESLGSWILRTKTDLTRSCIKYDKSSIHPLIISKSLVNAQEAAAVKNAVKGMNNAITISFETSDPDIEIQRSGSDPRPEAVTGSEDTPVPIITRNVQYLNIPPSKDDLKTQDALMAWEASILNHCFVYSLTE